MFLYLFYSLCYKRDFYHLETIKNDITVWKRWGGKCYIIIGKYQGLSSPSENIDYIEISNADNIVIAYDSININQLNIKCGNQIRVNSINYIFKIYKTSDWDLFDHEYFDINSIYSYISVDIKENSVTKDGELLKRGNLLGW